MRNKASRSYKIHQQIVDEYTFVFLVCIFLSAFFSFSSQFVAISLSSRCISFPDEVQLGKVNTTTPYPLSLSLSLSLSINHYPSIYLSLSLSVYLTLSVSLGFLKHKHTHSYTHKLILYKNVFKSHT